MPGSVLHRMARPQAKLESLGTVCVCVCVCVLLNHVCVCVCVCVLLNHMCVCVCVCVVQSCLTLRNLITVAHQAPLSMGFSGQEYWSGLPFLSPGDLPDPGMKLRSPALKADSLHLRYRN